MTICLSDCPGPNKLKYTLFFTLAFIKEIPLFKIKYVVINTSLKRKLALNTFQ